MTNILNPTPEHLQQAEMELQNAHSANVERIKSPIFGYDTFANLSGDQVAALLNELHKLRENQVRLCRCKGK